MHKYDTLNDTYTKLTDIPYMSYGCGAFSIGTDIYILGSGYSDSNNYWKYAYKYNTSTGVYIRLNDTPVGFRSDTSFLVVGTNVYITHSSNVLYKYDVLTDTYIKLNDMPHDFGSGRAVIINNYIYMLGGDSDYYVYRYDINKGIYTKLANTPNLFKDGSAVAIGTDIYLLGGAVSYYDNWKWKNIYDTNKIIFKTNPTPTKYTTILHNTDYPVINKFIFDDVFLTDSLGNKIDTYYYYGNGTSWIQIT